MTGVVRFDGKGLGPEIGSEVSVGFAESVEGSLEEVLSGSGMTSSLSVTILDTSEGEHLLGDGGTNDTGTSGSGDELDADGSTLAGDLTSDGMDVTDLVTPVTSSDGHKLELGVDESALNGDLDFLGDLDAETDVASHVTDGDNSLKAGSLTSRGLLLDGDDLHDVVLELELGNVDELVNNGSLLDGDGVGVDLLKGLDVTSGNQSAELGLGEPFVLGGTATATEATTATAATTASTTVVTTATSIAESTATAASAFTFTGRCGSLNCFSHFCFVWKY